MIEVKEREYLKLVVRRMYDAQKLRIQSDLRMQRLIREGIVLEAVIEATFAKAKKLEEDTEKEYERIIRGLIRDIPVVTRWLVGVRGIGPRLSGLLVGLIGDIERFPTVSKLWAFAGLHVIDGHAVKRAKGQKANWSAELKTTCWKAAQSFVKSGGRYREMIYDPYKKYLVARELAKGNVIWKGGAGEEEIEGSDTPPGKYKPAFVPKASAAELTEGLLGVVLVAPPRPEWTLGRINNMALRRTAKMFLSHLWHVWREIEGLSTAGPYAIERLGHTGYVDPWKMMEEPKEETEAA